MSAYSLSVLHLTLCVLLGLGAAGCLRPEDVFTPTPEQTPALTPTAAPSPEGTAPTATSAPPVSSSPTPQAPTEAPTTAPPPTPSVAPTEAVAPTPTSSLETEAPTQPASPPPGSPSPTPPPPSEAPSLAPSPTEPPSEGPTLAPSPSPTREPSPTATPPAPTALPCDGPRGMADRDDDGWPACEDCDDLNSAVWPGAQEVCGNSVDEDCSGAVDDAYTYYPDLDGDGQGDASQPIKACATPAGHVASAADCDDGQASVYVGAPEVCDNRDNDCDGSTGCRLTGAIPFSALATPLLTGEEAGALLGSSVAVLDLDHSGGLDIVAGAPVADHPMGGPADVGVVYVLLDPWVNGHLDAGARVVKLVGRSTGDQAGLVVAALGDATGDGIDDLAVASPYADRSDGQVLDVGAVYLVPGERGPLDDVIEMDLAGFPQIVGNSSSDRVGLSLAAAGDMNNDSLEDFIVGCPYCDQSAKDGGLVGVFFGADPTPGEVTPVWKAQIRLVSTVANDLLGSSVAGGLDLTGLAPLDLLIGARGYHPAGSTEQLGAALVVADPPIPGGNTQTLLDTSSAVAQVGEKRNFCAGASVTTGDLDEDPDGELVVVDPCYTLSAASGALYGVLGPELVAQLATAPVKLTASDANTVLGTSLNARADLDGDGWSELMVGNTAKPTALSATHAGVMVFYGPLTSRSGAISPAPLHLTDPDLNGLGAAIATADMNGDGRDDLIVGLPRSSSSRGAVAVILSRQ